MLDLKPIFFTLIIICTGPAVDATVTDLNYGQGDKYIEYNHTAMAIDGTLQARFSYVLGYERIDFNLTPNSGSITTANVSWQNLSGAEVHSQIITSGSGVSKMRAPVAVVTITNNTGGAVTVTGNVFAAKGAD